MGGHGTFFIIQQAQAMSSPCSKCSSEREKTIKWSKCSPSIRRLGSDVVSPHKKTTTSNPGKSVFVAHIIEVCVPRFLWKRSKNGSRDEFLNISVVLRACVFSALFSVTFWFKRDKLQAVDVCLVKSSDENRLLSEQAFHLSHVKFITSLIMLESLSRTVFQSACPRGSCPQSSVQLLKLR